MNSRSWNLITGLLVLFLVCIPGAFIVMVIALCSGDHLKHLGGPDRPCLKYHSQTAYINTGSLIMPMQFQSCEEYGSAPDAPK